MTSPHWKPIAGYGAEYEVSREGEVRNVITGKHLRPAPSRTRQNRLRIGLTRYGERKFHWVARLVLIAFVGKPPSPKHEAEHLDFNTQHNAVENLRWATHRENVEHSVRAGRFAKKLTEEEVRTIRSWVENGRPTEHTAFMFLVSQRMIQRIAKRELWAWVE